MPPTHHPAAPHRHRKPGPATGATPDPKDAHGPIGTNAEKAKPVSPLLAARPIDITAEILGEMVPTKNIDANKVAQNLNATVAAAKVKTALAQSMLIAQLIVESGGFTKETVTEGGINNPEVYNPGTAIPVNFKQTFSGKPGHDLQRYLFNNKQHPDQISDWRESKAEYDKAKAVYEKANPGKNFDASGTWKYTDLTDYIPGDVETVRWKLWYDPESPFERRAKLAKSMKNVTPGDGKKFVGRGYIQLTWRTNYLAAADYLNKDVKDPAAKIDLDGHPELAALPDNSIKISAWFWNDRGCNGAANADTDDAFVIVSEKINGATSESGVIGMPARRTAWEKVKTALTKRLPPATAAPNAAPTVPSKTPPPVTAPQAPPATTAPAIP